VSDNHHTVELREVERDDLDVFFRNQQDTKANDLAKVFPREREDFYAHWERMLIDPEVLVRTIMFNEAIVGTINAFMVGDEKYVGYWIGRDYWGKGIATRALASLLPLVESRPLHARVAVNNIGSICVLERCGFVKTGEFESPEDERFAACIEAVYRLD